MAAQRLDGWLGVVDRPIAQGMAHPHASASATGSARTHADRAAPADISSDGLALLRRRDLALVPLLLISAGSFALSLSEALRPSGQTAVAWGHELIIAGALVFGALVGLFAASQERGWGKPLLGSLRFYLAGAAFLLLGLVTVAIVDRGLMTVAYGAVVLVASYVGLVFPGAWSRAALCGLLALTAVVQVVRPDAGFLDAATVFTLIAVGWFIGLLPRIGHQAASEQALLQSRSDALTGALNRRGLLEEFAYRAQRANDAGDPLALLVIDLNGFKQINDVEGHAAGDAILAWVGATVPTALPEPAIFGRLGGDEFAVLLPRHDADAARVVAERLRIALAERIGASIGIATGPVGRADREALMQAADVALYAAKAAPDQRVQFRAADDLPSDAEVPIRLDPPPITYARLRAGDASAPVVGEAVFDGRWMAAGFAAIALAGIPIVGNVLLTGGESFFENVLRYLGIPWVLANAGLGYAYRNATRFVDPMRVPWTASAVLVGGGVGAAALASGDGITAPIMAAFFMKVLFDASMARQRMALENLAVLAALWVTVLVLGPADALWAGPYQLLLLAAAHILGVVGRGAFDEARTSRIRIARHDALTGLLNRRGFEQLAAQRLAVCAAGGPPAAVVVFDLDDFKGINDTQGHAAGDQLLRAVAHLTRDTLSDAYGIGRIGGDEFVALVPVGSPAALLGQLADLDSGLSVLVGGSIGSAIFGEDGTTLDELLGAADSRAYEVKRSRQSRSAR